jgi:RNase adapter protein RapZ
VTDILVITGLAGAGRSQAAAVLEDLGWYVVDNLPASLIRPMVEVAEDESSGIGRLALVAGRQQVELLGSVNDLRMAGHRVRVLFLDASDDELVRRYENTRRRHPLEGEHGGVLSAIVAERRSLESLRAAADLVIDTSDLNVHQLRIRLVDSYGDEFDRQMRVVVESFGFKYGLPLDADVVMDVRFLPNPHWDPALRPLTGRDDAVREFVLAQPATSAFLDRFEPMIAELIPQYTLEGKSYLTVAIGCTGGRHRSVALAEEISRRLSERGHRARTAHRDIER